jgi:hypothetical protein
LTKINLHPTNRQLRQFGFIALVAFGVLGALVEWRGGLFGFHFGDAARWVSYSLWALGVVSALLSLVYPAGNRFLFLALTIVTYPIGTVVSFVLMAIFFYGIVTLFAIVFRLIGRDVMKRKFEPEASTYWAPHTSPASIKRYFQQF